MKRITIYLSCALTMLFSCNARAQVRSEKLGQLGWILGTWEMKAARGTLYEMWSVLNDSTFQGKSFKVTGKDTVVLERIQLTCRKKKFYYTPTVSGQNDQMPVSFLMTSVTQHSFIAENPQHDFPQRIGYRRSGDMLDAWIDGKANGKYAKEEFRFIKI